MQEEIMIAVDVLKKRMGLSTRAEVLIYLLNKEDPTLLQLAARRIKLGATKGTAQEEDEA